MRMASKYLVNNGLQAQSKSKLRSQSRIRFQEKFVFAVICFASMFPAMGRAQNLNVQWPSAPIQVVNLDVAKATAKKDPRVISEGGLRTDAQALQIIYNNGRGVFCKVAYSDSVQVNSVLNLKSTSSSPIPNTDLNYLELKYASGNAEVEFNCVLLGDVAIDEVLENVNAVVAMKDAEKGFPDKSAKKEDEDLRRANAQLKSFQVLDAEKLKQTGEIGNTGDMENAIVAGKIYSFDDSYDLVQHAREKVFCTLTKAPKNLKDGDVFTISDYKPISADMSLGTAQMQYHYRNAKNKLLVLTCNMRINAKERDVINTFDGVLDFNGRLEN